MRLFQYFRIMPNHFSKMLLLLSLAVGLQTAVYGQKSNARAVLACNCRAGNMELQWFKVNNPAALKLPVKAGSARLPKQYTVFTTHPKQLHTYMMMLKAKGGSIVLPSSGAMACRTFSVTSSGTMSPELAAKFPQIVSLKGFEEKDHASTVRIDSDGSQWSAEMTLGGVAYIISPWKKGAVTYYLLYKKEDSGVERKPLSE